MGWTLVSEGVEKSWGDLGRFDLSRKLFATGSDWRETMGDGKPRFAMSPFSARQREKREKERGKELGTTGVRDNTELECGSSN